SHASHTRYSPRRGTSASASNRLRDSGCSSALPRYWSATRRGHRDRTAVVKEIPCRDQVTAQLLARAGSDGRVAGPRRNLRRGARAGDQTRPQPEDYLVALDVMRV